MKNKIDKSRQLACIHYENRNAVLHAPFSLSRFKVPVHPGLMIRDEPCHNRGGTVDNFGDPG